MRTNPVKQKLRDGQPTYGTWLSLGDLFATRVLARMGWNVAIDTLVGEVPILGDLFDVGFKANLRNLALLEGMVERPAETRRASRRVLWLVVLGLVLVTAGAIALGVLLVQLIASALQGGLLR